jgi:LruC domain-containing protein
MKTQRLFKAIASFLAAAALFAPGRASALDVDVDGTTDAADAVPCDPNAVSVAFAPAKDQHGVLVFEDKWPEQGDLDFNDVTLAYNYIFFLDGAGNVSSLQASINLLAAGGTIPNGVRLHLPVEAGAASVIKLNFADGDVLDVAPAEGEDELVIPLIDDVTAALGGPVANASPGVPAVPGVALNLYVAFASPVALPLAQAPFDLYLERTYEAGHQIHQVGYAGTNTMDTSLFGTAEDGSTADRHFVDSSGLPFALAVPATFAWPQEAVQISTAYPDVTAWVASGGTEHADWYETNVQSGAVYAGGSDGSPRPTPVLLGPTDPSKDVLCAPWKGIVQYGLGTYTLPFATVADANDAVITAGVTYESSKYHGLVVKHDSGKNLVWTQQLSAPDPYASVEVYGAAVDPDGNVYLSGQTGGSIDGEPQHGSSDPFVAKLDPDGTLLWAVHVNPYGGAIGRGVAVHQGRVLLSGYGVVRSGGPNELFVASWDTDGQALVIRSLGLPGYYPWGITTDATGNVFISGYTGSSTRAFITKASPTLATRFWVKVDTSPYSWSQYNSLAVDDRGDAYLAGYRQGPYTCNFFSCGYIYDAPLWKYQGSDGALLWTASFAQSSVGLGAAVGSDGNPVYVGVFYQSGNNDAFVSKVDRDNGQIEWLWSFGEYQRTTQAFAVTTDSDDSAFVAGVTNGTLGDTPNPNGDLQTFIAKYASDGTQQ